MTQKDFVKAVAADVNGKYTAMFVKDRQYS